MAYFKVEAQDDTMYFSGDTLDEAKEKFTKMMGEVPASLLTWTSIESIPEGEECG